MDVILKVCDDFALDFFYDTLLQPEPLPRDSIWRQALSLYLITWVAGTLIYLACASFSYAFIYDKRHMNHSKFMKNQVYLEIKLALESTPVIALFTAPIFLLEVRGFSKLYGNTADGPGIWYDFVQFPLFLFFTDFGIYWIHRFLHHPAIYKYIHKPHHKWVVPTPYASVAFHPLDGFLQSVPYHLFPFILPLRKFTYLLLFVFVQVWTVIIHDGEYVAGNAIINGAACHTMHHMYSRYNYGQFTTLWDRIGGSYRPPTEELVKEEKSKPKN